MLEVEGGGQGLGGMTTQRAARTLSVAAPTTCQRCAAVPRRARI